jgi:hypothetical protein
MQNDLFIISIPLFFSMRSANSNVEYTNLIRYYEMQRHMDIHEKRIKNVQPTLRVARELSSRVGNHIKKQPLA